MIPTLRYAKLYFQILLALSFAAVFVLLIALVADIEIFTPFDQVGFFIVLFLICSAFFYGCIAAIEHWYYAPLSRHSEWVTMNGAFSRKQKSGEVPVRSKTNDPIIQSENLKQLSVADELAKWAKLRDDGLVSEAEFEQARSKLLHKM
jgi:hypothetical protein